MAAEIDRNSPQIVRKATTASATRRASSPQVVRSQTAAGGIRHLAWGAGCRVASVPVVSISLKPLAATLLAAFVVAVLASSPARAAVRTYDLGDTTLPDASSKGPLPVRLWGVIGIPDTPGKHPLVIVAHGRHGDNCPHTQSFVFTWPCYGREQRNDLGMRHIVRALSRRGIVAVAPDLNASYTIGWGDDDDERRWPRIANRTISLLAAANTDDAGHPFGIRVEDRIDLHWIGLLGHSRSGHNAVRFARSRSSHRTRADIAAGRGPIRSLFLLAPVYRRVKLPDVETAVVLSECDGDVHGQGRHYLEDAQRRRGRRRPVLQIRLGRANHNYFNSTLSDLGTDDGRFGSGRHCRDRERLAPATQQTWIDKTASAFFAHTLRRAPAASWMRPARTPITKLYGLGVKVTQLFPRR